MASIWNDSTVEDTVRYIDETSWSNLNDDNLDAYTKESTQRKVCVGFCYKNDSIKLTTILPSVVLGPGIGSPVRRGRWNIC